MMTIMKETTSTQILSTGEAARWSSFLPAQHSVFGSVEFASIMEQYGNHPGRLFVFCNDEEIIVYPFFLRSISTLPLAAGVRFAGWWDTLSPEYTGPLAFRGATSHTANAFRRCFSEYCRQEQIIAEFAHLHPWNGSAGLLAAEEVSLNREIVYVDLTWSETQIWQDSLDYTCRKNIKRAERENVRVFPARTAGDIQEFYRIYLETMTRNQALTKYYFSLDYFMAFFERMPEHARFVLAEYNDQIIAGTLYLHDDRDVYSYLGGADHAFQHVRPTNLVIYETIRWARQQGKQRLILGGGYRPNDGIARFKATFSPLRAGFYVYKHIHWVNEYKALCQAWAAHYQSQAEEMEGYFPAYRATPVVSE